MAYNDNNNRLFVLYYIINGVIVGTFCKFNFNSISEVIATFEWPSMEKNAPGLNEFPAL